MGSLGGNLQRPLSAAAAVVLAAVSSDLPEKFGYSGPSEPLRAENHLNDQICETSKGSDSWVSHVSISKLSNCSHAPALQRHTTNVVSYPVLKQGHRYTPSSLFHSSFSNASASALQTPYQYAKLANTQSVKSNHPIHTSSSDVLYKWHLPDPSSLQGMGSDCALDKSQTVVVLLGWLGAKQKHLKRYADWYTSRGFHVVTFTFPMGDVLSYKVRGKAEQNVDLLANHLAGWLSEEFGKNLVFHTFSNTGWLTYGVILEKFQNLDPCLMEKIRGCIVDSAPVATPDPQVWASGFSAAFLKKQSVATKGSQITKDSGLELVARASAEPKPAMTEVALLGLLEKFFAVVLNIPSVNRRLLDVMDLLSSKQPRCPQLYIYSSSDRVIPAKSVESFVDQQRRAGLDVRACDFVSTPHVDHFRNQPGLYASELTTFLEDRVLTSCKCR